MTRTEAPRSFYFYDLETSGIDPRWHRVMQFAGLRTDVDLEPVGDEFCTYIKLPIDVLPDPQACRVTGLTPQLVNAEGMEEFEAFDAIERILSVPGTCTAGFNNLRFDDEFLRFSFYRHFIDPYAREFRDGNSRWDIIDLMRATAALRPEGIQWPEQDGLPSFRLELFTAANAIDHGQAHDALSDVHATIAAARVLRRAQPRLFEYYLGLRSKAAVLHVLRPGSGRACVHVSGRLPRERNGLGVMVPVAARPDNPNSVIAVDVARDFEAFADLSADQLREILFTPGDQPRPPIKEIRVNRCPFVAPLNVLRPADQARLGVDLESALAQADRLHEDRELPARLIDVYSGPFEGGQTDVDGQLYDGFLADADRACSAEVRESLRSGRLPVEQPPFVDRRLDELLFRLRARRQANDLQLGAEDRRRWREIVADKLRRASGAMGLAEYQNALDQLVEDAADQALVQALRQHGETVTEWLEGEPGG